jgi:hypothetical protein
MFAHRVALRCGPFNPVRVFPVFGQRLALACAHGVPYGDRRGGVVLRRIDVAGLSHFGAQRLQHLDTAVWIVMCSERRCAPRNGTGSEFLAYRHQAGISVSAIAISLRPNRRAKGPRP